MNFIRYTIVSYLKVCYSLWNVWVFQQSGYAKGLNSFLPYIIMEVRDSYLGNLEKVSGRGSVPHRRAVRILMLSPLYFRMDLYARKELVDEFVSLHGSSLYGNVTRGDWIDLLLFWTLNLYVGNVWYTLWKSFNKF